MVQKNVNHLFLSFELIDAACNVEKAAITVINNQAEVVIISFVEMKIRKTFETMKASEKIAEIGFISCIPFVYSLAILESYGNNVK